MFAVHVQKLCSSITSVVRVLMKIPTACTMNTSNSSRKKVQENEKVILSVTRSFPFFFLPFLLFYLLPHYWSYFLLFPFLFMFSFSVLFFPLLHFSFLLLSIFLFFIRSFSFQYTLYYLFPFLFISVFLSYLVSSSLLSFLFLAFLSQCCWCGREWPGI